VGAWREILERWCEDIVGQGDCRLIKDQLVRRISFPIVYISSLSVRGLYACV